MNTCSNRICTAITIRIVLALVVGMCGCVLMSADQAIPALIEIKGLSCKFNVGSFDRATGRLSVFINICNNTRDPVDLPMDGRFLNHIRMEGAKGEFIPYKDDVHGSESSLEMITVPSGGAISIVRDVDLYDYYSQEALLSEVYVTFSYDLRMIIDRGRLSRVIGLFQKRAAIPWSIERFSLSAAMGNK